MIAQSAFLCSLFETVCSESRASVLGALGAVCSVAPSCWLALAWSGRWMVSGRRLSGASGDALTSRMEGFRGEVASLLKVAEHAIERTKARDFQGGLVLQPVHDSCPRYVGFRTDL